MILCWLGSLLQETYLPVSFLLSPSPQYKLGLKGKGKEKEGGGLMLFGQMVAAQLL